MITLTDNEIHAISQSPEALQAAVDWHDLQECLGDAMGFDVSSHTKRRKEIEAEIEILKKARGEAL